MTCRRSSKTRGHIASRLFALWRGSDEGRDVQYTLATAARTEWGLARALALSGGRRSKQIGTAAATADGRVVLFALDDDDARNIHHRWQRVPNGAWNEKGWISLGALPGLGTQLAD